MSPELKKRWCEALRGNQYAQGEVFLRDRENRFTALGVLCDISEAGTWNTPQYHYADGDAKSGVLPDGLAVALEVSDEEQADIILMERQGRTFSEIANFLEGGSLK